MDQWVNNTSGGCCLFTTFKQQSMLFLIKNYLGSFRPHLVILLIYLWRQSSTQLCLLLNEKQRKAVKLNEFNYFSSISITTEQITVCLLSAGYKPSFYVRKTQTAGNDWLNRLPLSFISPLIFCLHSSQSCQCSLFRFYARQYSCIPPSQGIIRIWKDRRW